MQILQIDIRNVELEYNSSKLIVRSSGERVATVPIKSIDRLVICNTAHLPVTLLTKLAQQGTGIMLGGSGYGVREPLHVLPAKSDAALRQIQYGTIANNQRKATISCRFVLAKLAGNLALARQWLEAGQGNGNVLRSSISRLQNAIEELKVGGRENPVEFGTINGIEGSAAAAYFTAYRTLFPASLDFTERNRQPPRDPVNVCLSLGYTLAHHEALLALSFRGFDTAAGFLHQPVPGRDSLACDLTEPLRPMVDQFVIRLFRKESMRGEHFSIRDDGCFLGKAGRKIFYEAYARLLAPELKKMADDQALWLKTNLFNSSIDDESKLRVYGEVTQ